MVVQHQKVEEVVIRLTGEAVDFISLGIVTHGGVPVQVGWVQAVEPLGGIDPPIIEVVQDVRPQVVEVLCHGSSLLS